MRIALAVSLCLNLALGGWFLFCKLNRTVPQVTSGTREPAFTTTAKIEAVIVQPAPVSPLAPPFRWDQLYAPDYHAYVKNLRAIGCPEEALESIVTADVQAAMRQRAAELEQAISQMAEASRKGQSRLSTNDVALRSELCSLPDEEKAMIADYLGQTLRRDPAQAPMAEAESALVAAVDPASVPLVAQPVDLNSLNLDEGQKQSILDLQKSFLEKIGGPNQDPKDPAYQAKWKAAQAEIDNLMQGFLGDQAYQDYQLQVFARSQQTAAEASGR